MAPNTILYKHFYHKYSTLLPEALLSHSLQGRETFVRLTEEFAGICHLLNAVLKDVERVPSAQHACLTTAVAVSANRLDPERARLTRVAGRAQTGCPSPEPRTENA